MFEEMDRNEVEEAGLKSILFSLLAAFLQHPGPHLMPMVLQYTKQLLFINQQQLLIRKKISLLSLININMVLRMTTQKVLLIKLNLRMNMEKFREAIRSIFPMAEFRW